jgi:hypothetical protein
MDIHIPPYLQELHVRYDVQTAAKDTNSATNQNYIHKEEMITFGECLHPFSSEFFYLSISNYKY